MAGSCHSPTPHQLHLRAHIAMVAPAIPPLSPQMTSLFSMKHKGNALTQVIHIEMARFATPEGEYISGAGMAHDARLLQAKVAAFTVAKRNRNTEVCIILVLVQAGSNVEVDYETGERITGDCMVRRQVINKSGDDLAIFWQSSLDLDHNRVSNSK